MVRLSHGFGYTTVYAHLNKILVEPGQDVKRGEQIGELGSTGRSTGPHLHYEVYVDGKKVGQAPGQWRLAAGKHRVEVRYPVAGKEQKRRFRVVIIANETKSLGVVDFTKP